MPYMVVTLDVSRLSGWLNADADCRVERRAYEAGRGEVWARKQEVCRRRRRKQRAGKRTQNMLDMPVTLDVSRLSGWLNVDAPCRVERRAYNAGRGVSWEAGRRGTAVAQAACTHPPTAKSRGGDARRGGARARRREGGEATTAAQTVCSREGPAGG